MSCTWGWPGTDYLALGLLLVLAAWLLIFLRRKAMLPQRTMSSCSACGGSLEPAYFRCPHCGKTLKGHCPNCSGIVESRWRYCPDCGTQTATTKQEYKGGAES